MVLLPRQCLNIIGLGCSAFARHYLRNHFCFLLLWVLRCFSSPRSPSLRNDWPSTSRVAPFGNLGIKGYLHLPQAYRSLSRPSSPPRAKASAMRPCLLLVLPTTYGRYILSALTLLFYVTSCQRSFYQGLTMNCQLLSDNTTVNMTRVENNGFEPLTPCVQSRCSSQLS